MFKNTTMSNLLMHYLNKRMTETEVIKKSETQVAGPVITISREVGCNGVKLANLFAMRLNIKNPDTNWKVISKEVFQKSAKELKMEPEKVRKTMYQSGKTAFDDILKAFYDKNYKSNLTIGKTMNRVILQIATDGHCIIIGRAGHIIADGIKNALHIRLVAPFEYRIHTIIRNNHLSREEAIKFIHRVDKERTAFRKALLKDDPVHEMFDITFNRAAYTDDELLDLIEYAAKQRNLIKD
jgi:cytidylate kinase